MWFFNYLEKNLLTFASGTLKEEVILLGIFLCKLMFELVLEIRSSVNHIATLFDQVISLDRLS